MSAITPPPRSFVPVLPNLKILITGGTGFLGRAIIAALQEQHPHLLLFVTDIRPFTTADLASSASQQETKRYGPDLGKVTFVPSDITKYESIASVLQQHRPDVVVHTAGIVPTGNARYSQVMRDTVMKINVEGTKNVVKAAREVGTVRALIYTSSVTVVTDWVGVDWANMREDGRLEKEVVGRGGKLGRYGGCLVYGESKGIAENFVLAANDPPNLLTTALRPSVLFGPGDYQLIPTIHNCISKNETPFIIGTGLNLFDFTYVGNVADAHVLAIENLLLGPKSQSHTTSTKSNSGTSSSTEETTSALSEKEKSRFSSYSFAPVLPFSSCAGSAFTITNSSPLPFRSFMLAIWSHFSHIPPFHMRIPRGLAYFAGLLAEIATWVTGREATLSTGSVQDACQTAYSDIGAARAVLGYEPRISFEEGLRVACLDYQERLKKGDGLPRP
jgi:sterol-4alpha-carboxylate 3-dehydrogenase (decarboxylating)